MKKPLMTVGLKEIITSKSEEYKMERDSYKLALEEVEECLTWDIENSLMYEKISDIVRKYLDRERLNYEETKS